MVDIKMQGNRVVLENYRIKSIPLMPEWEIVSTEETMPMFDEMNRPLLNDAGDLIVFSKFTKLSRVVLRPEEKVKEKEVK